jgi:hypothetical protein
MPAYSIFLYYIVNGGHNRARTYDPLLVRQMLSQLSYAPIIGGGRWIRTIEVNDNRFTVCPL